MMSEIEVLEFSLLFGRNALEAIPRANDTRAVNGICSVETGCNFDSYQLAGVLSYLLSERYIRDNWLILVPSAVSSQIHQRRCH